MSLPILQPSSVDTTQVRGDVTIHSSVMIASGVILNATSGYKIIVASGVCLGMGTIINAYGGNIEIGENSILGSGSLIFGSCTIGKQVSLGASVTVYNATVKAMSVICAGSIIGDSSRQVNLEEKEVINPPSKPMNTPTQTIIDGVKRGFETNLDQDKPSIDKENNHSSLETPKEETTTNIAENNLENPEKSISSPVTENQESDTKTLNNDLWEENPPQVNTVVGQVYINKLLLTLFPHKQKN